MDRLHLNTSTLKRHVSNTPDRETKKRKNDESATTASVLPCSVQKSTTCRVTLRHIDCTALARPFRACGPVWDPPPTLTVRHFCRRWNSKADPSYRQPTPQLAPCPTALASRCSPATQAKALDAQGVGDGAKLSVAVQTAPRSASVCCALSHYHMSEIYVCGSLSWVLKNSPIDPPVAPSEQPSLSLRLQVSSPRSPSPRRQANTPRGGSESFVEKARNLAGETICPRWPSSCPHPPPLAPGPLPPSPRRAVACSTTPALRHEQGGPPPAPPSPPRHRGHVIEATSPHAWTSLAPPGEGGGGWAGSMSSGAGTARAFDQVPYGFLM